MYPNFIPLPNGFQLQNNYFTINFIMGALLPVYLSKYKQANSKQSKTANNSKCGAITSTITWLNNFSFHIVADYMLPSKARNATV